MEEKDFEAKLSKITHDVEQLSAKIDDKLLSLKEEMRKSALLGRFVEVRDVSFLYIDVIRVVNSTLSEAADRARSELESLSQEYMEILGKVSSDQFNTELNKFKARINRITRPAGLGEMWKEQKRSKS